MQLRPSPTLKNFATATNAVASIEFAISGIALFFFLLAILNLGDLGLVLGALQHGAQTAARAAAVQTAAQIANAGSCTTQAQVQSSFNTVAAPPLPPATGSATDGSPTILTSWTNDSITNAVPGTYVTVTASYHWVPIGLPTDFAAGIPLSITATQIVLGTSGAITSCS